jgi:hypothetical protein
MNVLTLGISKTKNTLILPDKHQPENLNEKRIFNINRLRNRRVLYQN